MTLSLTHPTTTTEKREEQQAGGRQARRPGIIIVTVISLFAYSRMALFGRHSIQHLQHRRSRNMIPTAKIESYFLIVPNKERIECVQRGICLCNFSSITGCLQGSSNLAEVWSHCFPGRSAAAASYNNIGIYYLLVISIYIITYYIIISLNNDRKHQVMILSRPRLSYSLSLILWLTFQALLLSHFTLHVFASSLYYSFPYSYNFRNIH